MKNKAVLSVLLFILFSPLLSTSHVNAAPGNLDASFGKGGVAMTSLTTGYFQTQAIALQNDSKILLAGYYYDGSYTRFGLLRFNPDGSLDPTFGNFGLASIPARTGVTSIGYGVAVQPDGKIVMAGNVYETTPTGWDYYVARFNTDGSLDKNFGPNSNGTVSLDFFGYYDLAHSVMIQSDGKIAVFGYSYNGGIYLFSATRFTSTGTVDTSFGPNGNGRAYTAVGSGGAYTYSAVMQSDGKFVVVGSAIVSSQTVFAVVRFNADGSIDTSFGSSGSTTTPIGTSTSIPNGVALQADGKIIAAGWVSVSSGLVYGVARYNTNGSLDTSFNGGKFTTQIGGIDDEAYGVAVQGNGKIIVAGYTYTGTVYAIGLVRYDSNGTLDSSFGKGGKDVQTLGTNYPLTFAIALQPDGKILAAGSVGIQAFVARFQGDPPLDNIAPTWSTGSNLTATTLSSSSVFLTWTPATDNVGVTGYRVYQGSTLLATLPSTASSYLVSGLTQGSSYTFKVQAGDAANNWSANGPSASVTLPAPPSFFTANLPWLILIAVVIGFGVALVLTKPKAPKMG